MDRRWMAWLAFGSCLGCAPGVEMAADTERDTDTGTGTSTGDAAMTAASVSVTSPSSQTAASMSASGADDDADDDGVTTAMTTDPDPDSTGPDVTDDGSDDDRPCTPGQLDCACDVGSACDGSLMCVEGVCVAEPDCEEPEGEPNDDEASAIDRGTLQCGADAMEIEGAFDGADMDWYTMVPMGGGICFGNPSATVAVEGDAEVTVCIYADCNMGGTNVGCGFGPGASMPDTSPDGADGCCDTGSVDLESVSCGSFDQSYVAWVRVSTAQRECLPYTLTLEY